MKSKILFILFLFIAISSVFADTPSGLIQRFDKLPKAEQEKLKEKVPFFDDKLLEQFRNLTEGQQSILINKYNIDMNAVEAAIKEIEKKIKDTEDDFEESDEQKTNKELRKIKKENQTKKDETSQTNTFKEDKLTKREKENSKKIENEEPELSEIDRLNQQFKPEVDKRKILSKITELDKKEDEKNIENKENKEKEAKQTSLMQNTQKVQQPIKSNKEEEFTNHDKQLAKENQAPEKFNLIDDKLKDALKKIQDNNPVTPYGYELFEPNEEDSFTISKKQTNTPLQDDYILGPTDELIINLYGSKNQEFTVTISQEGLIHIPNIGPLSINGLSYKEAKSKITKTIQEKMLNTEVFVSSGKVRTINIFLMGEFKKPRVVKVASNATLMDALFLSQGIKEIGSLRNIQIKRSGNLISNVDLYDFLQRGDSKGSLSLANGDIVFCPIVGPTVTVIGAVLRPAKYELKNEKSIREGLQLAGSATPNAYLKNVRIERLKNFLNREIINLDLSDPKSQDWAFSVNDGDIIQIATLVYERTNSVFLAGNVKRPGVYSWQEGLKVSDIIKSTDDLLPQTEFSYAVIERESEHKKQKVLISFNLEDVLLKKQNDVLLKANDKIIVYNVRDFREQPVVRIEGQVVAPKHYAYYEGMRVSDLVLASGGLREDAYKDRADLYRWLDEKGVFEKIEINLKDTESLKSLLKKRDRLTVYSIWDIVQKSKVTAVGMVNKPGEYLYFVGMRVSDLIFAAGSLTDDADRQFASLHRKYIDDSGQMAVKYFSIDLAAILKGSKEADLALMPKDSLEVLEISKFVKEAKITIYGEVKNSGSYQWGEGMRVSDAMRLAGGLEKSAYLKNAELTHYEVENGQQRLVSHESVSLERILAGNKDEDKLLQAYDQINILKVPGWNVASTIDIRGEVLYPGVYTIEKDEKITDLIQRAGGLTENAYPFAAFFSREKVRVMQKEQMERRADELEKRMLNTQDVRSEGEAGKATTSKANIQELINRIRNTKVTGRISFNLEDAIQKPDSSNNMKLEGNDILIIPAKAEVVYVLGEVRNETTFILDKKLSMKDYINKAGGFTSYADAKHVYIVRADGSVANFKSIGFRNGVLSSSGYTTKSLMPGDTIVVPEKLDRYEGMKLAKDISQILYQIALSAAAFVTIGAL